MATFSNLINCIRNYSTESHSRAQDFEFNVKLNQETFSDLRNFIDEAIESKESCPIAQITVNKRQRAIQNANDLRQFLGCDISFSVESLDYGGRIFSSLQDFVSSNCHLKEPEVYYICDIDYLSSEDINNTLIVNYQKVILLLDIFDKVGDHTDKSKHSHHEYYILREDKVAFKSHYTDKCLPNDLDLIQSLHSELVPTENESHLLEKRRIFCKVLYDHFKSLPNNESNVESILANLEKIFNQYRLAYDLYINEFSFNKFLDEISRRKLDFINQLNDIVSDVAFKLISLPIAAVVISIVDKSESSTLIKVSATLYAVIILILLYYKHSTLSVIQTSVDDSFSYLQLEDDYKYGDEFDENLGKAKTSVEKKISLTKLIIRSFAIIVFLSLLYIYFCKFS